MSAIDSRTADNREQWLRKPALREIYTDLYRRMARYCVAGNILEIGGGSGNFKEFASNVITSDIGFAPWLDLVADAQRLPIISRTLSNIVMFDVLHHIEFPRAFFAEAARVLKKGGRIVMVEPAITAVSWPFYHFIHPEPVDMDADPLSEGSPAVGRDAFESNQAFPTLLVHRHKQHFERLFPTLKLHQVDWLSLLAYPLSGGFRPWSAIPAGLVPPVLRFEAMLAPFLGWLLGFRMLIVIEAIGEIEP